MEQTTQQHPTKIDAEQVANRYKKDAIIIVHLDYGRRTFGYASYGKNSKHCDMARRIGDQIHTAIATGAIKT